jgi:hypothetical protein
MSVQAKSVMSQRSTVASYITTGSPSLWALQGAVAAPNSELKVNVAAGRPVVLVKMPMAVLTVCR